MPAPARKSAMIARVKFLPGKLEEWKRLTAEATGDQPKLFTPWMAMSGEPVAAE